MVLKGDLVRDIWMDRMHRIGFFVKRVAVNESSTCANPLKPITPYCGRLYGRREKSKPPTPPAKPPATGRRAANRRPTPRTPRSKPPCLGCCYHRSSMPRLHHLPNPILKSIYFSVLNIASFRRLNWHRRLHQTRINALPRPVNHKKRQHKRNSISSFSKIWISYP